MSERYAYTAPGGAWEEITPGQPFRHVVPGQVESVRQDPDDPDNLDMVDVPLILTRLGNWLEAVTPEERAAAGVLPIIEVAAPTGYDKVVSPGPLEDFGGQPRETWSVRTLTLAEVKAKKLAEAEAYYHEVKQAPFSWDFGATPASDDLGGDESPAGVQTLQMRQTGQNDDVKNWLAVAQGAALMVGAGAGAGLVKIKTTANVWVHTTAAEVVEVLLTGDIPSGGTRISALAQRSDFLANFGAIKKQIQNAATKGAVQAIDHTAGYAGA